MISLMLASVAGVIYLITRINKFGFMGKNYGAKGASSGHCDGDCLNSVCADLDILGIDECDRVHSASDCILSDQ